MSAARLIAIGRADDSDLVVNNHLISRLHAQVELKRGKFQLLDQSTNGTFVLTNKGQELFVRRDSRAINGRGLYRSWQDGQAGFAHTQSILSARTESSSVASRRRLLRTDRGAAARCLRTR